MRSRSLLRVMPAAALQPRPLGKHDCPFTNRLRARADLPCSPVLRPGAGANCPDSVHDRPGSPALQTRPQGKQTRSLALQTRSLSLQKRFFATGAVPIQKKCEFVCLKCASACQGAALACLAGVSACHAGASACVAGWPACLANASACLAKAISFLADASARQGIGSFLQGFPGAMRGFRGIRCGHQNPQQAGVVVLLSTDFERQVAQADPSVESNWCHAQSSPVLRRPLNGLVQRADTTRQFLHKAEFEGNRLANCACSTAPVAREGPESRRTGCFDMDGGWSAWCCSARW